MVECEQIYDLMIVHLKLSLNIETIIPEDDSVRLLSQFVEAMDLVDL